MNTTSYFNPISFTDTSSNPIIILVQALTHNITVKANTWNNVAQGFTLDPASNTFFADPSYLKRMTGLREHRCSHKKCKKKETDYGDMKALEKVIFTLV